MQQLNKLPLWYLLALTLLATAVIAIHDPAYTGIKTKTYRRDPVIAQAFEQQQQKPQVQQLQQQEQNTDEINEYGSSDRNYHQLANSAAGERLSPAHERYNNPKHNNNNNNDNENNNKQQQQEQQQQELRQYDEKNMNEHGKEGEEHVLPLYKRHTSHWNEANNAITEQYNGCPPDYMGALPYPYDCRRFLNCWRGRGYIQSCAPGTAFNPETLECDNPNKVVCGVNGALDYQRQTPQVPARNWRNERLVDAATKTASPQHLCAPRFTGLQPHPTDCTKFVNCANGVAYVQSCSPGTAFCTTLMACDYKHKVNCGSRSLEPEPWNTQQQQQPAYGPQTPHAASNTAIECPSNVTGRFMHPFSCALYLQCRLGVTIVRHCPNGTMFDREHRVCAQTPHLNCLNLLNTLQAPAPVSLNLSFCPPDTEGQYLYPYDNTKYVQCRNGHLFVRQCPVKMVFSYHREKCMSAHLLQAGECVKYRSDVIAKENLCFVFHFSMCGGKFRKWNAQYTGAIAHCPPEATGLFQYPFNEIQYVSCNNGILVIHTCPSAFTFLQTQQLCLPFEPVIYGQVARSAPFAFLSSDILQCPPHLNGLVLHPFDCTKYLRCQYGQRTIESCAIGSVFSITQQKCIQRDQVDAYDRVEYLSDTANEFSADVSDSHTVATPPLVLACPEQNMNALYMHPFDGSKYLRCTEQGLIVGTCGSHKLFSITEKSCVTIDEINEYDRQTMNYYRLNEIASGLCGSVGHSYMRLPHNCTKFIECHNGIGAVRSCVGRTAWNNTMKVCDHQAYIQCMERNLQLVKRIECLRTLNGGLFPSPFNFGEYITCEHNSNVTQMQRCPTGYAFSIKRRICAPLMDVPTFERVQQIISTTSNIGLSADFVVQCPPQAHGLFLHPFDATLFIKCENSDTFVGQCLDGGKFDYTQKLCLAPTESHDANAKTVPALKGIHPNAIGSNVDVVDAIAAAKIPQCPPFATGLFAHPYDCTKFLNCRNGTTYVQSCGPGTAWNVAMEVCDYAHKVNCPPTHSFDTDEMRLAGLLCEQAPFGLQAHPHNCTLFINCSNGIPHVQMCAPGTAWNSAMELCDYIERVDCAERKLIPADDRNREGKVYGQTDRRYNEFGGGISTYQTQPTYGGTTSTTARTGDRWSNMDMQRPEPQGYPRTWSDTDSRQQPLPVQPIIWEEGTLQPNRNYHKPYQTPLAPMTPRTPTVTSTTATNTNTNIYYTQPVFSQEDNSADDVYSHTRGTTASHLSPILPANHLHPPSRTNHSRAYNGNPNTWQTSSTSHYVPTPNAWNPEPPSSHLMPPLPRTPDSRQYPVPENSDFRPVTKINLDNLPATGEFYLNRYDPVYAASEPDIQSSVQPTSDNLFGGLQPPYRPTTPLSPANSEASEDYPTQPKVPYVEPTYPEKPNYSQSRVPYVEPTYPEKPNYSQSRVPYVEPTYPEKPSNPSTAESNPTKSRVPYVEPTYPEKPNYSQSRVPYVEPTYPEKPSNPSTAESHPTKSRVPYVEPTYPEKPNYSQSRVPYVEPTYPEKPNYSQSRVPYVEPTYPEKPSNPSTAESNPTKSRVPYVEPTYPEKPNYSQSRVPYVEPTYPEKPSNPSTAESHPTKSRVPYVEPTYPEKPNYSQSRVPYVEPTYPEKPSNPSTAESNPTKSRVPYVEPTYPEKPNYSQSRVPYVEPTYPEKPSNPSTAESNPTKSRVPYVEPSYPEKPNYSQSRVPYVEPTYPEKPSNSDDDEIPSVGSRTNVRTFQIYPPTDNTTTHGMPHYSSPYAAVALASFNPRSNTPESDTSVKMTPRHGLLPPAFNREYYKPASPIHPNSNAIDDEDMQLPISDALRALLRPYFNRSGTVNETVAEQADSHIMNVLSRASFNINEDEQTDMTRIGVTTTTTTTPRTTTQIVPGTPTAFGTDVDWGDDVELIIAGEQDSLSTVTVPTQNTTVTQTTRTTTTTTTTTTARPRYPPRTFGHSREFHSRHPNMPSPFTDRKQHVPSRSLPPAPPFASSKYQHHHHHDHHHHRPGTHPFPHSREFHLKHPKITNPFSSTDIDEADHARGSVRPPNDFMPTVSSDSTTTPASTTPTVLSIDRRGSFDNVELPKGTAPTTTPPPCDFDCGNGNCINSFEVCDGINNCGNRRDESDCSHLGYQVRLAGGETANVGRIEVKILGKWGYVCDDKFGLRDADVVCKELGFQLGALEVRGNSFYAPPSSNPSFVMDEVDCRGNETSLKDCDFKGWGVNNCGADEVAGVACKVPQLKCPKNFWLCSTSQECIPPAFVCDNTPDCEDKSDESEQVCNSRVEYRLDGGRSANEGRLEVLYRGKWGTICDDDFGLKEAQVACNSLGYFGKPTIEKNIFGPGSGPIWLDQVACFGNETALDKCSHWTWGEHNCNHTEDVGLRCTAGPPPRKTTSASANKSQKNGDTDDNSEELAQTMLEDIGLYTGQVERSSKFLSRQQRRCGHFKDDLFDAYEHPEKERVLNGTVAKRGRHPWQATIRLKGRGGISSHWCGAVLISKKHLLTAAHCLVGYQKGAYFVRLGDHYANIAESSEIDTFIENWYIHEKFRDKTHMNNDIALIVLKNPVRYNDYIQPICLPEKGAEFNVNRMCTISGWGSIKSGVSTPSNILRAAQVPLLADDICRQPHVYGNSMTDGMFCAGLMDESVDACDGDSGGPLVCSDQDGETLYGIISWGQHCGYPNKPGVYVRVEKYIDWIYEKINLSLQQAG